VGGFRDVWSRRAITKRLGILKNPKWIYDFVRLVKDYRFPRQPLSAGTIVHFQGIKIQPAGNRLAGLVSQVPGQGVETRVTLNGSLVNLLSHQGIKGQMNQPGLGHN
jgi:hypothetical protein